MAIRLVDLQVWNKVPERKEFSLTVAHFCFLRTVHAKYPPYDENSGKEDLNVDYVWAQLGTKMGFKWWTIQAIAGKPLAFTAEIAT